MTILKKVQSGLLKLLGIFKESVPEKDGSIYSMLFCLTSYPINVILNFDNNKL